MTMATLPRTCEHCGSQTIGSCPCPKATMEWIADQRVEIRRKMHELKKLEQSTKRQLEK
jgi:rRNA maturation protein Nop10